jgi:hypothetical protein
MNIDTYYSSTFLYKNAGDDKLYFGPPWDYDASMGIRDKDRAYDYFYCTTNGDHLGSRLFSLPEFRQAIQDVYKNEMRDKVFDILVGDKDGEYTKSTKHILAETEAAALKDFDKWGINDCLGSYYPLESYETTIQTDIIGSLHMYGGRPEVLKTNPDYTVAHYPHQGYSMSYYRDGVKYSGMAINGNYGDYALAFMCGDQPLTVITTDLKNGKTLLVFKESYGNAFIPYMIDYFERIVVVDIRESVPSVASIVADYNVTDALIINNCQGAVSLQSNLEARALS